MKKVFWTGNGEVVEKFFVEISSLEGTHIVAIHTIERISPYQGETNKDKINSIVVLDSGAHLHSPDSVDAIKDKIENEKFKFEVK